MSFSHLVNPLVWFSRSRHPRASQSWGHALLRLVADRIQTGQCNVVFPNGGTYALVGREGRDVQATLRLERSRALRRLMLGGDVGFAEAYIDGDWDTPDLRAFLTFAALNEAALGDAAQGQWWLRLFDRLRHRSRANSRRGSRKNIAAHYDISNAFYAAWLDPTMTYSSAMFLPGTVSLDDAQRAKNEALARFLDLRPHHHLLEIGCGWGSFAAWAAETFGCRVTAITLSKQQQAAATERVQRAGLGDRVEVRLQDYRDVQGTFDRIASIEMFEAVGEAYWPVFFGVLRRRLRPGGVAAMQVITIADDRFPRYRRGADFIQRHIFPGGMLPSPSALRGEMAAAGLTLTDERTFGLDYARTLELWRERFETAWPAIAPLGFDERFRRLWRYYLTYCEVGFRTGAIDVGQYRLVSE
jgi:cyclopropane-fatty-acyl-phospholipid synthase